MLTEKIKFLVAGFLTGFAILLLLSGSAVTHDLVRDGRAVVAKCNVRQVSAAAIVVRRNALPIGVSVAGGARRNVLLANFLMAKFVSSATGPKTVLATSSSHPTPCNHGERCGCCGVNGACCGMSCCATALRVRVLTLPNADRHALTISASEQIRAATVGTLFRPPRALA